MRTLSHFISVDVADSTLHLANVVDRHIALALVFVKPIEVRGPPELLVTCKYGVNRGFFLFSALYEELIRRGHLERRHRILRDFSLSAQ